ncbi:aspartate dehydrogenase [Aliiruegeria haliotis]|uniref:L-aspartate dehydrogenase n=2 Tax=Aliiruegeria haliotis TaxID=1280846 RepID=A0A2T0RFL4_9RHOB|nr:aspartate dehydrogenase [Aliiruegeria haliotis]
MHLGLIGYGSIAHSLIGMLPADRVPRVTVLVRPASLDKAKHDAPPTGSGPAVQVVSTLEGLLAARTGVVVECAGHAAVARFGADILRRGIPFIPASLGALADADLHENMLQAARTGGARLTIPAGAIGGLDLLQALALNGPPRVTYRGIKPPAAWKGSPADAIVDLDALATRTVFFSGTGREAASAYPKNANVVAAIALSGGGFDHMKVELVADPEARANSHSYEVISPICTYTIEIANSPNPANPRTSMTTVASLLLEILRHDPQEPL